MIDNESKKEQTRLAAIAYVKKYHRDPWNDAGGDGRDHINTFVAGAEWHAAQSEPVEVNAEPKEQE